MLGSHAGEYARRTERCAEARNFFGDGAIIRRAFSGVFLLNTAFIALLACIKRRPTFLVRYCAKAASEANMTLQPYPTHQTPFYSVYHHCTLFICYPRSDQCLITRHKVYGPTPAEAESITLPPKMARI